MIRRYDCDLSMAFGHLVWNCLFGIADAHYLLLFLVGVLWNAGVVWASNCHMTAIAFGKFTRDGGCWG